MNEKIFIIIYAIIEYSLFIMLMLNIANKF